MNFRLPKTRRYRVLLYIMSTFLVLLAIDMIWARIWRHISVSPETTHITSPLKPDGTPDFLAFINDQTSLGVTQENNAAIPFVMALTPTRHDENDKEIVMKELYERLNITPPAVPLKSVSFDSYLQNKNKDQTSDARNKADELIRLHPWSPAEHPDAVAWLRESKPMLDALPEITSRPRWFMPAISHNGLLISVLLPWLSEARNLCNIALSRAMMNIHEGHFADAQTDIIACHKLGRLFAQNWTLIDYLVGTAIDNAALQADATFVSAPNLPAEARRQFITQIDALAPFPTQTHPLEFERYAILDCLIFSAQHPVQAISMIRDVEGGESAALPDWLIGLGAALHPAHYNAVLRKVNVFYDGFIQASKAPGTIEREKLLAQVEANASIFSSGAAGPLGDPSSRFASLLIPALHHAFQIEESHDMNISLARISLALASYHADKGAYPVTLAPLAPEYIPAIPTDAFTEEPLHYKADAGGYLLYSVGPNRKDDGGQPHDNTHGTDYDLVFKMPN
ncbi:MAG TPA: hypothetical protein VGN88_02310 [Phycisphaerae bacterium]|jgi:hypothetical protein